jgi:DNA-binding GntR family transcriptional regulator
MSDGGGVGIDYLGKEPLWSQLAGILRGRIADGTYEAGRRMPSETHLVQEYGLARGTVRQAMKALEDEGLVVRVQGRGTFVR